MTITFQSARTPRGPKGHYFFGVLPQMRSDVLAFLRGTFDKYGDVARYRVGPLTSHLVAHPDGVKRILHDNAPNYTKDHFTYRLMRRIAGKGLVTNTGPSWLQQRRLAQPAFHKNRIAAMAGQMATAARDLVDGWKAREDGAPLDLVPEMMRLTLRISTEALFSAAVDERTARVGAAFSVLNEDATRRINTFNLFPPVLPTARDRRHRAARRRLDRVVQSIIDERRRTGIDRGDLLSMFMLAHDEDSGAKMTDEQLRDEVVTMLIAGFETTTTTLAWACTLLARHPEVEARLHAEVDAVLGKRAPIFEDVRRLEYTRMVIEETLRLFPPAYLMSRRVEQDDVVCGFRIPRGCTVEISPYVTHRHPEFWEEPDAFRPERFRAAASASRPRFAYFPFSGGPRQCIGNAFALMEAQIILATIAQHVRLRLMPVQVVEPEPLLTLRLKGGLPMIIERRISSAAA